MEVRIEADGCELPEGSCICVRIGDVQKQTAYDPKKVYRFPEARRFGKIDLYQKVGTCEIQWGLDEPESRTCRLVSSTGEVGACLNVKMSRAMAAIAKSTSIEPQTSKPNCIQFNETADKAKEVSAKQVDESADKAKEVSARAKAYLLDHDIEGIFTNAMRSLIRAMPEDPAGFLRDHIGHCYSPRPNKQTPVAKRIEPLPVTTRPACLGPTFNAYYRKHMLLSAASSFLPDFHARASWQAPPRQVQPDGSLNERRQKLRAEARDCLLRATEDGTLQEALLEMSSAGEEVFPSSPEEKQRRQARDALVAANADGTLQNAVQEHDLRLLRERARDVFVKTCRDGSLQRTWTEVRTETLRTRFQGLFWNSSSNGDLDDALSDLRTAATREKVADNIASADSQDDKFAVLRAKACESFSKASQDGTLEQKVRDVLENAPENLQEQSPSTPASPKTPVSPSSSSAVNKKARKNLLEGLRKGTLEALVVDMEATEEKNETGDASASSQGIADLPARIASCLDASLKSGELTIALSSSPSKAPSPPEKAPASSSASALNKKARKNLLEGLRKGTLEALVVDMEATEEANATVDAPTKSQASGTANLDASREKLQRSLLEAAEGGQIAQTVQTISDTWEIDLTRTRKNLLSAAADGSLAKLIVELASSASSTG